jgi:hypothetical protein
MKASARGVFLILRLRRPWSPFQGQWRLWWDRPGPEFRGLQEAPAVVIAGKNGRAGCRDSGRGRPRQELEYISFEPREEGNPAVATESIEKRTAGVVPQKL